MFEGFPIQIAGKTGTAEKGAGRADQSWYVALAPWPDPKYVVAVTDEAGGFGADTAAPMARRILAELFDVETSSELVEGGGPVRLMSDRLARPATSASRRAAPAAARPAAAARHARPDRGQRLHASARATQDDIAGRPELLRASARPSTAASGIVLMLLISRFDYSRLREWKLGVYGLMIGAILLVYALGFSARGSQRAIEFGFFNFQASELGKLLLVAGAVGLRRSTACGGSASARPPAGSCCSR